ncbi:hypothetical protein D3C79_819150 [compost metagenome]
MRQAAFEQLGVTQGTDAVRQYPGKRQVRLITRQPQGQSTERLSHGGAVDHRQHRHIKMPGQIGTRRCTVEQPHDPFDQDQVGFARRFPQQTSAFLLPHHPQVELVHRRTTGSFKDHRIKKIRAALEHPHLAPEVAVQPRQGSGHRSLALA